jgi:hypothetical protein
MVDEDPKIRIYPLARAAFPGSVSKFEIEVDGGEATTIDIRPCDEASSYDVSIVEKGDGKTMVTIKSPPVAENACLDFFVEAKDSSGNIIAKEHAELVTGPKAMPPTFAITTVSGVILVIIGMTFTASASKYTLIALGVGVSLAAIIASLFGIYGKNIGYPFHFTKEK